MKDKYTIYLSWKPRLEDAEAIHQRMKSSISVLSRINPEYASWTIRDIGVETERRFGRRRRGGKATPANPLAEPATPAGFMMRAGKGVESLFDNSLLAIGGGRRTFPGHAGTILGIDTTELSDRSLISYAAFKSTMMALVPVWDAAYAHAYTTTLQSLMEPEQQFFPPTWMTFLSPEFAKRVTVPPEITAEDFADGGVLFSAVAGDFDSENPKHLAAAQKLGRALAPLEKLYRPT